MDNTVSTSFHLFTNDSHLAPRRPYTTDCNQLTAWYRYFTVFWFNKMDENSRRCIQAGRRSLYVNGRILENTARCLNHRLINSEYQPVYLMKISAPFDVECALI